MGGLLTVTAAHLNTLDLDFCGFELMLQVVNKVRTCRDHGPIVISDSLKGYHLLFYCKVDCDDCRLVFDDPERFARDRRRPWWSRNVLFDRKIFMLGQRKGRC
jgi:hypothetical protein